MCGALRRISKREYLIQCACLTQSLSKPQPSSLSTSRSSPVQVGHGVSELVNLAKRSASTSKKSPIGRRRSSLQSLALDSRIVVACLASYSTPALVTSAVGDITPSSKLTMSRYELNPKRHQCKYTLKFGGLCAGKTFGSILLRPRLASSPAKNFVPPGMACGQDVANAYGSWTSRGR